VRQISKFIVVDQSVEDRLLAAEKSVTRHVGREQLANVSMGSSSSHVSVPHERSLVDAFLDLPDVGAEVVGVLPVDWLEFALGTVRGWMNP
jgi:hypothetical protein